MKNNLNSNICLISKKHKSGKDFRPITCINTLYELTLQCIATFIWVEVEK